MKPIEEVLRIPSHRSALRDQSEGEAVAPPQRRTKGEGFAADEMLEIAQLLIRNIFPMFALDELALGRIHPWRCQPCGLSQFLPQLLVHSLQQSPYLTRNLGLGMGTMLVSNQQDFLTRELQGRGRSLLDAFPVARCCQVSKAETLKSAQPARGRAPQPNRILQDVRFMDCQCRRMRGGTGAQAGTGRRSC